MKANGEFESMEEGFAFCRECNRPVIVQVDGQRYKLFPSGKAVKVKPIVCPSCKESFFGFKAWEAHVASKICAYGRTTVIDVL